MSRFIKKALEKAPRLEKSQVLDLLRDTASENNLYEAVLQSLSHGLVVLNMDHRVLFSNKMAELLLPWQGLDALEKPVWLHVKDNDVSLFLRFGLSGNSSVTQREFSFELGGKIRILGLSLLPLVSEGRICGNMIQIIDVTDKKNSDNRLRRAETLASLTTLAAGVAHEIKNPLGSISIHLQLIQKSLDNPGKIGPENVRKFLGTIQEEVDRLNGIVVDFLFAVRPMDTTLVLGSMNKVIADLVDFLKYELSQGGVEVILDLESGDDSVLFDERFLKQAYLNIIKNSIHAMESGGKLTIQTLRSEGQFQVKISDTGVGIPPENLEKIFEPYFTTKSFGSGLGLTLVYKIIKEHGADIQVHSKVGQGTTFAMTFPPAGRQTPLLEQDPKEGDR